MKVTNRRYREMFRLGSHIHANALPPTAAQVLALAQDRGGHLFMALRPKKIRLSVADGQAYLHVSALTNNRTGWWNVVRLLLEIDGRLASGRSWLNRCGFPECVRIDHWAPNRYVTTAPARPRLYNVLLLEGGRAGLQVDGVTVTRDAAFPGRIADRGHLVRYLHDADTPRFVTACGINIEPRTLVPGAQVDCPSCLS